MKYKHEVIDPLSDILEDLFKQSGIDIIKGTGRLKDKNTVTVENRAYTADYIVLATGQRSHILDIEGKEYLHDSRDFLDLETFPEHITIIGGGYIGIEFASIASKMGSKVTVISHSDKVLKAFYQPHVDRLVKKLESEHVTFHYHEDTVQVEKQNGKFVLHTKSGLSVETDYVLDATGRIPNVEGLGLDEVGVKYSTKGIKVNNHLQTSVDNIYASGDVLDKEIPKLTPTATFESNYIAMQILGKDASLLQLPLKALELLPIKYPAIPSVVYSLPRLAQVGMPIDEAAKKVIKSRRLNTASRCALSIKMNLMLNL